MSGNTASQLMDKQIMDLSSSHSIATANSSSSNTDFIDFMNRPPPKKDDIVPSYDFMPIRPAVGSSSPPATRSSNFDSGDDDGPLRTWNSLDSKINASPIRNYSSLYADEPAKFSLGKGHKPVNASLDVSLVSEIDKTMKKYADDLMHTLDGVSAQLSQLETRSRNLENSMDYLKVSIENNQGSTDGKIRQLENILREVHAGVQVIRDKQEAVEAQLHIAKLQIPHVEQEVEIWKNPHIGSAQPGASADPQFSTFSLTQPTPTLPPPNVPQPSPQQNLQPQVQLPNQFPQNQVPSVPQQQTHFPQSGQTPENPSLLYQITPPQQQHPIPPPPQHQYQLPSQLQQPSFSGVNTTPPQPPLGHPPEEAPYAPPIYPPPVRPSSSHPPSAIPPLPSQQFYGPTPSTYEAPSGRPGPGYSGPFGPTSGHGEPYTYSSPPPHYGDGPPMKPIQLSSQSLGQSGGSGYSNLPTARILPQSLPTASSSAGGSGNRVPIDDVVDKVTNMGFPRDQVRATVRKLTENGQSVDLNIVLDKLMNDGDDQAARGWFAH
ncbi:hypothetical protein Salat_1381600 [Sesamum alatum]|uniref:DUF1421 domain-containing protein n=1 Tax=Sesamum alatum TaxID=300844 RepID=A0AAE1Y9B6_9LAMI|nr:hypothetical protein Salat_1381600 [Sesamum alatum]